MDEFDKPIKSASAGKTVYEENLARAEQAGTQTPFPSHLKSEPGESTPKTNADKENLLDPLVDGVVPALLDAGKSLFGLYDDADSEAITITGGTNFVTFQKAFDQEFEPSPNPTTEYAQLTYNIGLYLATPDQYKRMRNDQTKSVQGLAKVLQSGGNNISETALFPDLFIENLKVRSILPEGNQMAHNVTTVEFNIIEPMGYTFLNKLKKLCAEKGLKNFIKQHYILVIKYRGYDENSKQVSNEQDERLTKVIPIQFQGIRSKVATGGIEYECKGIAINHGVALSAKRATIPFNVELLGQSIDDIFNAADSDVERRNTESEIRTNPTSPWDTTETVVTPGILTNSAGSQVASKGVVAEMNKQAKKLLREGVVAVADKYKVTFKGDIGKQRITSAVAKHAIKNRTPMSKVSSKSANAITNDVAMDKSRQIFSIPAGNQMHQLIDLLLRSSEWTQKQQKWIVDEDGGQVQSTDYSKALQWWHIGVNVTPIAWDSKRGDYAYEIEYVVSPKKINDTYSPYFNKAEFKGVHKSYSYWFTGKNTEILEYTTDLNATYFIPVDGKVPLENQDDGPDKENLHSKSFVNKDPSGSAQPGSIDLPAEQAADVIYSAIDFAMFEMEIIGDPDYVMQNDILFDSGNSFEPFLEDGSINYDSQEVLVGVNFKTIEDYDATTGGAQLLDPLFTLGTKSTQGLVYKVTEVTSNFEEGKMTQRMRGILREFPKKAKVEREQPVQGSGVAKSRLGNKIPGLRAIIEEYNGAPNFAPISVDGNRVPGTDAVIDTTPIAPDFGGRRGDNVPGQRAVSPRDTIGPNL